jgi:hypothetical protein
MTSDVDLLTEEIMYWFTDFLEDLNIHYCRTANDKLSFTYEGARFVLNATLSILKKDGYCVVKLITRLSGEIKEEKYGAYQKALNKLNESENNFGAYFISESDNIICHKLMFLVEGEFIKDSAEFLMSSSVAQVDTDHATFLKLHSLSWDS